MLTDYEEIITALQLQGELTCEHLGYDMARVVAATGVARMVTQRGIEVVAWRLVFVEKRADR
jgi:hypothetical protein